MRRATAPHCCALASSRREASLQLKSFPGEQAQVDWAHFGHVMVGRARRALSCFVATLSYSRGTASGILLRSNHGELPPWAHSYVSSLVRSTASDPLRQSQKGTSDVNHYSREPPFLWDCAAVPWYL